MCALPTLAGTRAGSTSLEFLLIEVFDAGFGVGVGNGVLHVNV